MNGDKSSLSVGELAHWGVGAVGGVTLAADHMLYGLVLLETHSRPRE